MAILLYSMPRVLRTLGIDTCNAVVLVIDFSQAGWGLYWPNRTVSLVISNSATAYAAVVTADFAASSSLK